GEALMGEQSYGIDINRVMQYANDIKEIHSQGLEIAIVIGGGNIYRGLSAEKAGMDRVQADYMGMLATVINSMALQDALEKVGVTTRLTAAMKTEHSSQRFLRRRAVPQLETGSTVIPGARTAKPYLTTDAAASLPAMAITAADVLKGLRLDGNY